MEIYNEKVPGGDSKPFVSGPAGKPWSFLIEAEVAGSERLHFVLDTRAGF
jgi:hypothetical protein